MRQSICVRRSLIIRLWRGEGSLPLRKVSKEIVEDEELKTLSENIGIQTFHNTKNKNTEIYERRALMGSSKHEDAIMKMGFRYFRDTILKLLGIDYTYVDIGPTELVELTIHSLYMDFTFLTTSGQYVHAEFQTTNGGEKDLRRFHAYEAVLSHESGKSVITYVIYSGGIKNSKTELDCGVYTYRVIPVYMTARDAEEIKEVTAMTRLGQMLYDDGFKSGSERMTKLTRILLEENRLEDLKKVTEDKEFREELMKKYNIQ